MVRVRHEVVIQRPIAEVFAFIADPANDPKWHSTTVEVQRTRDGPIGVGSEVTQINHFLGRRMETTWEITDYKLNEKLALTITSGPILGTGAYLFEAVADGTRLTDSAEMNVGGLFKLAGPIFARMAKRQLKSDCKRLKEVLERAGQS